MGYKLFSDYTGVKNIIIDLGGVILDIHYEDTIEAFQKLGIDDFRNIYTLANQNSTFDRFDTGSLTQGQFRNAIREFSGLELQDELIDQAWGAMLGDLPVERLNVLKKLKNQYRLFLLSNTNSIHIHQLNRRFKNENNIGDLSGYFEKIYYSFQVGLRKPDPAIFRHVVQENDLNLEETLFIDDSEQHILGAKGVGLITHHLSPPQTLLEFFS